MSSSAYQNRVHAKAVARGVAPATRPAARGKFLKILWQPVRSRIKETRYFGFRGAIHSSDRERARRCLPQHTRTVFMRRPLHGVWRPQLGRPHGENFLKFSGSRFVLGLRKRAIMGSAGPSILLIENEPDDVFLSIPEPCSCEGRCTGCGARN